MIDARVGTVFKTGQARRWNVATSAFVDVKFIKKWDGTAWVQTPKG
jgi:hypothetical protein